MSRLTRRRLLRIAASAATCLGVAGAQREPLAHRWTGAALGAEVSLTFFDPDPARARQLIATVLAEIDRLDRIFSLQRADSALSGLNRGGRLRRPPLDLVAVLELAASVSALSDGAFDVTVQPLWRALALDANGPATGRPSSRLAAAAALIDWRAVEASPAEIVLRRPGMAVTLNGIAQGYITDRVADMLRDAGLEHALVALGEQRALGRRPDGRAWQLGSISGPIVLDNSAVAVSGPAPARAAAGSMLPHLLDPHAGGPVAAPWPVAVSAPRATLADALSTALAVAGAASRERIATALPRLGAAVVGLRA